MRSTVDALIVDFEPWFKDSKLPFFPDYTDHGISHVEDVLTSATSLVSDYAWKVITAQDAGMLIIATLLHDCAMHLTEDGFIALVTGKTKHHGVKGFDSKSWPELWNDFLFSAMRYDDRTIEAIFGQRVIMRRPPLNPSEMTQQDRKLIGEFLRRHHGRLAHEIALAGVPGPTYETIKLSNRLPDDLADLAGLIARSHSLSLRTTFRYLEQNFHQRSYRGAHAIYLMVLLRIADYLQIQTERAPKQMLQVKSIQSPISRQEWNAHGAVVNIVPNELDPESILIQAKPRDVKTYLRLKEWLEGIQSELDTSWAVLGEVYAPVGALRNLGLVLRRVRSNLDDEEAFAKQAPFVPKRIEFDISRAETLKLLIRPLYGDRPEIGIRELIQNGVDAVRELWDLQQQLPELLKKKRIDQEDDIIVWLDEPKDGHAWLTVSDCGIGMTEDTIQNYFLKVGASFRYSEAWSRQHEERVDTEATRQQVRSRVLRSGRFGIGVLAAFLLGDYLEVATRHVTAEYGLRFSTNLDSEPIEVRRDEELLVGTVVRVLVDETTYTWLSSTDGQETWDWYCLKEPSVTRLLGADRKRLSQRIVIPDVADNLPSKWHKIDVQGLQTVHWSFSISHGLAYNGIRLNNLKKNLPHLKELSTTRLPFATGDNDPLEIKARSLSRHDGDLFSLELPLVSVFDPDGNLPLDLTRTKIVEQNQDLIDNLLLARIDYFLAYIIAKAPTTERIWPPLSVPDFVEHDPISLKLLPWLYKKDGMSLVESGILQDAHIQNCLVLVTDGVEPPQFFPPSIGHDAVTFIRDNNNSEQDWRRITDLMLADYDDIMQTQFNEGLQYYSRSRRFSRPSIVGSRLLVTRLRAQDFARPGSNLGALFLRSTRPQVEWENESWALVTRGRCAPTRFDLDALNELPVRREDHRSPVAAEWFFPNGNQLGEEKEPEFSRITLRWREVIQQPLIPYDLSRRKKDLAYAYEVLKNYLSDF